MATTRFTAGLALPALALLAGCGGSNGGGTNPTSHTVLIALDIPVSADPYIAGLIKRGATLAVDEANAAGGVKIAGVSYQMEIKVYDDNADPQKSAANVDAAIHDGAVAVIEDGLGSSISAAHSGAAGIPEIDITNGNLELMDNVGRPSLFRLGIPNDAAAGLLGTYIQSHSPTAAIIHDDSENGRDGATQLTNALMTAGVTPSPVIEVAAASPTVDTQIQQVVASQAGAIALWGSDVFIAKTVAAIRAAGVSTPIYTGPSGASPTVRAVAGAVASEGLRIVTGRMTSEADKTAFGKFEQALAKYMLGPTDAGFKNAAGQEIRQPNDIDFFAYDAVRLVEAALQKQGSTQPGQTLIGDMSLVTITSANGDARGFDSQNHEAFAAADVYIAGVHDMQYEPVKDETLSATLPTEDEILSDFH